MTARRIALVHFTAPPVVGGVEALIAAQADVLSESGAEVTMVTAAGEPSDSYRLEIVPQLHPNAPAVRAARESNVPAEDHPLVREISAVLAPILRDQDQVWVHNALTVYLNPFFTAALQILIRDLHRLTWVAFCHDLSGVSRYWDSRSSPRSLRPEPETALLRFVVLSPSRRAELASLLDIPEGVIDVVPPPLDGLAWLDVGEDARQVASLTDLFQRDLTFLIPAKLLPHKRIELAVRVTADLKRQGLNPLAVVTAAPSSHEPGVSAWVMPELQALARREGVEWHVCLVTGTLAHVPSSRTVRDLMNLTDLVFLPSAEEGYGAPINEAIALRAPLLCSDIPAFCFAAGAYASYTDPTDISATAGHMLSIAQSPAVVRRREVLRSWERFRAAILALAASGWHDHW